MNAPLKLVAARASHFAAKSFTAWRVPVDAARSECYPLDLGQPADLAEAASAAERQCNHLEHFVVREIDALGDKATLHIFAIRRESKRKFRRDPLTGEPGWSQRLYRDHLFSMQVRAFDPVEPWRWTPGCDPVGIDRSVVQGQLA